MQKTHMFLIVIFLLFLTIASCERAPSPSNTPEAPPPGTVKAMFRGHSFAIHQADFVAFVGSLHPAQNDEPKIILEWITKVGDISSEEKWYDKCFKNFWIGVGKIGQNFKLDQLSDWLFKTTHRDKILNRPGEGIWNLSDNDWIIIYSLNGKTYAGFVDETAIRPILDIKTSIAHSLKELKKLENTRKSFASGIMASASLVDEIELYNLRKQSDKLLKAKEVCAVYQQYTLGKGISYFITFLVGLIFAMIVIWKSIRARGDKEVSLKSK